MSLSTLPDYETYSEKKTFFYSDTHIGVLPHMTESGYFPTSSEVQGSVAGLFPFQITPRYTRALTHNRHNMVTWGLCLCTSQKCS